MAAAVVAAPAMAADTPSWYVGFGLGQSNVKDVCSDAAAGGFVGSCDDKDTGWKIFGGYEFNRNFGVELGYVDLGKVNASGSVGGVAVNADAKTKGWEVVGIGTIPLHDQFGVYGKLGFFRWDVDVSATAAIPPAFASTSAGATGTDITYGLGAKFDFSKSVSARAEWQRYDNIGDSATTGKAKVNLYSAGIVARF